MGMRRMAELPSPQTSTARTTEWCASSEQYTAAWRPPTPSTRDPASARSRAASSAVRFDVIPPLVNAPSANGKPTNSATQRRSEEHTSELQSRQYLVCRLLLEKKKINPKPSTSQSSPLL